MRAINKLLGRVQEIEALARLIGSNKTEFSVCRIDGSEPEREPCNRKFVASGIIFAWCPAHWVERCRSALKMSQKDIIEMLRKHVEEIEDRVDPTPTR